jgi:F0F1-type ATP synthase delta subunit
MRKRLQKVLRGDVERLVCSNVASGNVANVEELANVATETMLLRQRLAMMEDRLRSEYNRALADSDHTYKLTVKLVLEPKDTEDQRLEKWAEKVADDMR